MTDSSVQKLRDAFANAPAGTVVLNDAFWSGAGLTPPPGFTASIKAAYRLPVAAAGLDITYDRGAVTPVANDTFQIPGVGLTFLTAPAADTTATIYGSAGAPATPILGIDVVPAGWQLADQFPAMSGWPFTILQFDQQRFFFTSAAQSFPWNAQSATLNLVAGQNLYGAMAVPQAIQVLCQLIQNLPQPPSVVLCGSVVLDKADNDNIQLPDMDLSAPIPGGQDLQLFFLNVSNPLIGFLIQTVKGSAENALGTPEPVYFQTPYFYLETTVTVSGVDGAKLPMALRALASQDLTSYRFSVAAVDSQHPITPASILTLMTGSYFAFVPPALQQYLASVQMQGFSITGPLQPKPGINSLSALLGSIGGPPPLFTDPTTGEVFDIKSFSLAWTMMNPGDPKIRQNLFSFVATFTLFPEIFRTKDGKPGGLFEITINEALDFTGAFTGKASFNDVLSGITGGAIGLPSGVEVDFSDIFVAVQPSQKSYALGFTVDADLDVPFVQDSSGKPLIQLVGMQFNLGASTPSATPEQKGKTVYTGAIGGQVIVGPLAADVRVDYDGGATPPLWQLEAALAQPLKVSELVDQFFRKYDLPPFLPGDLTVEAFNVKAKIPSTTKQGREQRLLTTRPARHVGGSHHPHGWRSPVRPVSEIVLPRGFAADPAPPAQQSSYQVSGKITWEFDLTSSIHVATAADIGLNYDGNRKKGEEFAGSVIATITIDTIGATVEIGYRFGAAAADGAQLRLPMTEAMRTALAAGDSSVLWMAWNGFRAEYSFADETVTFSLSGWTVGSLITALVDMLGDPYFTLPSPWDVLNQISLNGLSIAFNLKKDAKNRITASYSLPSPLDLGILKIKGLSFKQVNGKTTLAIDGSTNIPGVKDSPLFKPNGEGQDVKQMPKVPGLGNKYFHLYLLALGQRVAIYQPGSFNSTKAVIDALAKIPASDGAGLPFDPTQQQPGQPYYNRASDWLAAMHFGVFKIGDTNAYAIDLMIVFNDPDLYGLRLALKGDKVKVLDGLIIDVLYKKITDDIGCYQIELTLPALLRNLDIGAFSVTLPVIGLQIYTNGDFLVDFGFPYNLDFSRSFTAQGIIMGVPVLGSGGFYFGKLSNATAPNLPQTTKGSFHPVIVFGFGAQLGVGKYIDKGILKAGFSITVFGIIEGTIAAWHPYQTGNSGNSNELQGDYYFKISGSFGIIGKLYGTVDFVIIKADVRLLVQVVARIVYESFRKIPLSLTATVSVSVSISIDCGLFSITIDFSFDTSLSVELTIGHDSQAPWDDTPPLQARTLHALGIAHAPLRLDFSLPAPALLGAVQGIELTAVPQFTVLAREGQSYINQEGAFVLLFAMDAPPTDGSNDGANTSFGKLNAALLPWILASVHPETVSDQLPAVGPGSVSRPLLEGILKALADPNNVPFTPQQLVDFVKANFTVAVSAGDGTLPKARQDALNAGSTIFPAFAFLSLTVPKAGTGTGNVTVAFDNYVTSTAAYQVTMRTIFNSVAANVAAETGGGAQQFAAADTTPEPMAASIFADYFILLSRQLVQSAIDAFDDYAYPLDANTSIGSIVAWADTLFAGQLTAQALLSANLTYPLAADKTLTIPGIPYMVQSADTLASIATRYTDPAATKRWATDPAALILVNAAQNNLLSAGVEIKITVNSAPRQYTTRIGDNFDAVATGLNVTIQDLSQQKSLYTQAGLLAPAVVLTVGAPQNLAPPALLYKTAAGDTVQDVLDLFHMPVAAFLTPANVALGGLFKVDPALRFAVPGLLVLPQDQLLPAILRTGTVRQIAGMAARYMMHGMRLPVAPGLNLTSNFLYGPPYWPTAQTGYGLYQLTGQQFPLAENNTTGNSISLARPAAGFDWVTLGSGASVSISIGPPAPDVLGPAQLLQVVLNWARANGYKPKVPVLAPEPETNLAPRRYGMASYAPWQTSDIANLLEVTKPPANKALAQAEAGANPQPKPVLWTLSSGLLRDIERRQAVLAAAIPKVSELSRYLPVLAPSVGTSDPATGVTSFKPVQDFAFAVRVDFRIKHLAQDVDLAPARPDANSVVPPGPGNPGTPARPLAPFAYEIVGPNPAEAVLLERLLTAMASEGEDIVQEIFLLYGDINNGAKGLTSRASSEFLSFIVQSNLSTETNPPAGLRAAALVAAAAAPTGIANTPAEFIKLLWELSTVNSGGTFLFYQLLAEGTGLPAALFDDSGIATLTLVAAMTRDTEHPTGGRMLNAINALITTDPIDPQHAIVDLAGVSNPTDSRPLDANATLAGIAAFYSVDLGTLVRSNPVAPLKTGARIPIAGLHRQLQPADVGAGKDPLQALATYYSSGAVTPISKADIAAFNPGVAVAALAVFRIPPFTYAVAAGGPGNSFASIAAYYAADFSALAFQARAVPGLFAGPTIRIDPLSYDAQPNLGLGNSGVTLERERGSPPQQLPKNPTQKQKDDYAAATMLQLYQLLSAGIAPNAFFTASVDSAAFGPKDPPKPANNEARPKAVRRLAAPRQAPAADQNYIYDQALGFAGSSTVNPATPPASPSLPPVSANPYIGIGTIMQFRLAWQDLFGNRTPNPFSLPQPGDPPPFGGLPAQILYPDRPIPLDQWPSTTRAYRYSGAAGAPSLDITLKLDPTPYNPSTQNRSLHLDAMRALDTVPVWQRNAANDLAKYTLIYFQLHQDYTPLNIPGLTGPAITMSLRNSLLETPEQALPAAARNMILAYLDAAIIYLTARAAGNAAPPPADAVISLPVDLGTVAKTRDIIRLELELSFTRASLLVDPALRGLADGLTISSSIPVDGDLTPQKKQAAADADPEYPVALTLFAELFEKVFVTANWRMRVGTSSAEPSAPNNARAYTVWAVRMAELSAASPQGLGFKIGNDLRYYAPLPIASALQTLTVNVNRYATGQPYPAGSPVPTTFTSVDPNAWLAESLTAVDDFLSATYSTPAFVLDRLLGLKEQPSQGDDAQLGYLARMLQHKKKLATAIASTAASVLAQPASDLRVAAVDKLEQALLRRLSNANTLTCVTVLPVSQASYGPPLPPGVGAPRLFGQPQGVLATALPNPAGGPNQNQNFAISTAKIPLVAPGSGASTLAFLFTSRSAEQQAYVQLKLSYALSHVEHNIHGVPGIDNYEQSSWITFLTGPYVTTIQPAKGDSFAIPVALRALPTPATVVAQTGTTVPPAVAGAETPAELKNWAYAFSYLLDQAARTR